MRDHLEIDAARIHILQTSKAKISKLRLLFGNESPTRAPSLAGSVSPHHLSEPIGQEMFFDRNCSHANSSSSLYLSMAEASTHGGGKRRHYYTSPSCASTMISLISSTERGSMSMRSPSIVTRKILFWLCALASSRKKS